MNRFSRTPLLAIASGGMSALLALSHPIVAQSADQARLTVGIGAGWMPARSLWDVGAQSIQSPSDSPDLFQLHRETRGDINLNASLTYFGSPHFGVTGEISYLGLGSTDGCTLVHDGGDPDLAAACSGLNREEQPASVTSVQVGGAFRVASRARVQPYAKAMVGLAFTPVSLIKTTSFYGSENGTPLILTIYNDNHWHSIRTNWTAAVGLATTPSRGYQLRIEVRDTWMPLRVVAGPNAAGQGFEPPTRSVVKSFPSILIAFDVVLERSRGRRY